MNILTEFFRYLYIYIFIIFQYIYIFIYLKLHMCMMMMMMTKFCHGIDKFYQPNSGLRGSKAWDEAIYTYVYVYIYIYKGSWKLRGTPQP